MLNTVVAGILLGGFYAAISVGLSLTFGLLDIVNIAHPIFVILGSYTAYMLNVGWGFDPILSSLLMLPVFYLLGVAVYRVYYQSFERVGAESLRGLVFFFGILFLVEVSLIIAYGVDYRFVEAAYIGRSFQVGQVSVAFRLFIPFVMGLLLTGFLYLFLAKTFYGKAIMGVAQDSLAVRLMGANPIQLKTIAFGLSIATTSIAGALLIMIGPVEPSVGRIYIGRVFAIVVLGGMGSVSGTLVASLILGVVESLTSVYFGPAWAEAVSFGILLVVLAIRPAGIFGR